MFASLRASSPLRVLPLSLPAPPPLLSGSLRCSLRRLQMSSSRVLYRWIARGMCRWPGRYSLHAVPRGTGVGGGGVRRLHISQPGGLARCWFSRYAGNSGTLLHDEHEADCQGHHDARHFMCPGHDDQHATERGHRRIHIVLLAIRAAVDVRSHEPLHPGLAGSRLRLRIQLASGQLPHDGSHAAMRSSLAHRVQPPQQAPAGPLAVREREGRQHPRTVRTGKLHDLQQGPVSVNTCQTRAKKLLHSTDASSIVLGCACQ